VVVGEGEPHMVLDEFSQTSSTAMKRDVHDRGNKFVDGRHSTFFSGELVGELAGELLPAFFFSSQWLERADDVLNVKGTVQMNSK
jgi:hypothetical protein